MSKQPHSKSEYADLRKQAEKTAKNNPVYSRKPSELSSDEKQILIQELQVHQIELEMQNETLRQTQLALQNSQDKYLDLYEFSPVGYVILNEKGIMTEMNLTFVNMTGVERRFLMNRRLSEFILTEFQDVFYFHRNHLIKSGLQQSSELKIKKKDGTHFYARLESRPVISSDGRLIHFRVAIINIDEQKKAEDALRRMNDELENRVKERTWSLEEANSNLMVQAKNLEELNVTLKVLLNGREKEKNEIEANILANIEDHVRPYIEKLADREFSEKQQLNFETLMSNLDDIKSQFTRKLTAMCMKLTPAEIQIALLIKQGKTSKEIAETLCLAKRTIDVHRYHIRKKLGIQNKKISLRIHLLSFDK